MNANTVKSHDDVAIRYAINETNDKYPWLVLIMPFGLKLEMAQHFFSFFSSHYRLVVWESRSILDSTDRSVSQQELSLENHVADVNTILNHCDIKKATIVGYCSGAGIALALANRYPILVERLILVHGEYTLLEDSSCTTQFASEIDSLLTLAAKDEKYLNQVFEKIKDERADVESDRPEGIDLPFTKLNYLRRYALNYLNYKMGAYKELAQFVTQKTFLLTGSKDAQANAASTEAIGEIILGSEVYVDPAADHYGILRENSSTLAVIWNYLCEQRRYMHG